jgi:hypothetical protein
MKTKQFLHTIIALFFMTVIAAPLVSQHCLAIDQFNIEWSGLDDAEKESSKKLFDDDTKHWINHIFGISKANSLEELKGLISGYFFSTQSELIALILDPPEDNNI